MADDRLFEAFEDPVRGRGLRAVRAVKPGEIIFREKPAALVVHVADANEAIHRMIASMLLAVGDSKADIEGLVSHESKFDAQLLADVARSATPAVKAIMEKSVNGSSCNVTEAVVTDAYCKHCINSMSVIDAQSLVTIGMGIYPRHGAMLNHADDANCWTFFEEQTHELHLRAISPIELGAELTIAYVDVATPRAQLHTKLRSRYFFEPSKMMAPSSSQPTAAKDGLEALVEVERIGREHGYSFLHAHSWCGAEVADAEAAVAQATALYRSHATDTDAEDEDELATVLRSAVGGSAGSEACQLIPPLTRALEATGRRGEWLDRLAVARCLLHLYRFYYRVTHPLFGVRHLDGALAAIKLAMEPLQAPSRLAGAASEQMLQTTAEERVDGFAAASELAGKAARILSITHGTTHALTQMAEENVKLVEGIRAMRAAARWQQQHAEARITMDGSEKCATKPKKTSVAMGMKMSSVPMGMKEVEPALDATDPPEVLGLGTDTADSTASGAAAQRRTRKKKQKSKKKRGSTASWGGDSGDNGVAPGEGGGEEEEEQEEPEEPILDDLDDAVSGAEAELLISDVQSELVAAVEAQTRLAERRAALLEELAEVEAQQHIAGKRREALAAQLERLSKNSCG